MVSRLGFDVVDDCFQCGYIVGIVLFESIPVPTRRYQHTQAYRGMRGEPVLFEWRIDDT